MPPRPCKVCGITVQGHGRQYCVLCAKDRKRQRSQDQTAATFASVVLLNCIQCDAQYRPRSGRPTLREFCGDCALGLRAEMNKERDRERGPLRTKRDPVKLRRMAQAYKRSHPEWNRKKSAIYKRNHPERVREWVNTRRGLLANAGGRVTLDEFWTKCDLLEWLCQYCSCVLTKKTATMDHVTPLSRGGSNDIDNIVPACRSCNARKGNKLLTELIAGGKK